MPQISHNLSPPGRPARPIITTMRISNIDFTDSEIAALYTLAGQYLMEQGKSREGVSQIARSLSPANLVRAALGFNLRKQGGARARSTAKRKPPKRGRRKEQR